MNVPPLEFHYLSLACPEATVIGDDTKLCGCGRPVRGHPRCAGCGILVCASHIDHELIDGRCSACQIKKGR